ncbi:hypothetical protein L6R53_10250 [Myxococcota bacterium]|nr:hypothetical protein [Myxococcota bacterium]
MTLPAGPAPDDGGASVAGTWSGNVHVQRGRLVLAGPDDSLSGTLTTTHPTTGIARTVEVRGRYDEASRTLVLEEQLDPAEDPTAGRYEATVAEDGRTLTGRYHAAIGGRTATITLSRSGG